MARRNRILVILNCIVLAVHSILVFALTTFPVFALSAGGLQSTIASVILSLLLQTGYAPVNQTWINTLNSSYGIESSIGTIGDAIESGLLTQTASGLVDTGLSEAIASQSAYTELGLAEIFTTTADDVAAGVVAGSGAVNLATTAIHVGTAGTIGAFAGAVAIGVGLGVLANKVRNLWKNGINYEMPLSEVLKINDSYILEGGTYITRNGVGSAYPPGFYSVPYGVRGAYVLDTPSQSVIFRNLNNINVNWYRRGWGTYNDNPVITNTLNKGSIIENNFSGDIVYPENLQPRFNNKTDARAYLNSLTSDDIKSDFMSPDIIGPNGNHTSSYVPDSGYTYDSYNPVVPDGYDMNPVDMDDYQDYVDQANDNTENGDTGEEQGSLFDNLIDNLLVEPSLVPDQGVDVPAIPDRPIIPDQPTLPAKDPITQEEQDLINSGLANTELANVFPFCIPFDIYAMITSLQAGREAPVIVFEFPEQFGWGGIIIDLSRWDEAATILRHMELILFIIGLAVNTRSLIGATG